MNEDIASAQVSNHSPDYYLHLQKCIDRNLRSLKGVPGLGIEGGDHAAEQMDVGEHILVKIVKFYPKY